MATEVITLLASPVVEKTIEVAYKFCRNRFHAAYGVENDIEKLQSKLQSIAEVLRKTDCCNLENTTTIEWLKKLREVTLDADDLLETYATEAALRAMRKVPTLLARLQSQSMAQHYIRNLLNKIEYIYDDRIQFELPPNISAQLYDEAPGIGASSFINNADDKPNLVLGREEEIEKIVKWLITGESASNSWRVPVFAVTGMGGMGKTTLVQQVYNDKRVKDIHFKRRAAWVHVSARFNVDGILSEIHQKLRKRPPEKWPRHTFLSEIEKELDGNPLLLVLDDVWVNERLAWEELHHLIFRLFPKGSKVLVTSRDKGVVERLDASGSYALGTLPEETCRELFSKIASLNEDDLDEERNEIRNEIVKKCLCLPLSVKVMAAVLRGKEIEYWRRAKDNGIWATAYLNNGKGLSKILPALRFSFDDLPPILKVCFAFTCMYPKRQQIDKHELVKLWIAEGYVYHPGSGVNDTLEQLGCDYFDMLHSRSFFQLSVRDNKKIYSMHDLFNDLATYVSIGMQRFEDTTSSSIKTQCRHVSLLSKDIQDSVNQLLKARKMRTLLHPGNGTIDHKTLNKIFKSLRYMRVLDLSSSGITDLPKSIKHLKLLSYLDLSRTDLRLLPRAFCKLLNLQILKLIGCLEFQELPEELGNLKDLRHLELDDIFWFKCSKLPPNLGGLPYLHNLHCFHVHLERGYGIEELQHMKCLEGLLHIFKLENARNSKVANLKEKSSLTNLILEWSEENASPQDQSMHEEVLEGLQPYKDLEELTIKHYKGSRLSNWMGVGMIERFTKLHKVSLKHCVNCRTLTLGPLPHLRHLIIKGMLELEEWPENTSFLSLNRLTISHCPKLQNLPPSDFLSLRALKINQCYALKALPVMPFLNFLKLFNNDMLEDMNEVLLEVNVDANLERNCITTMQYLGNQMNLIQIINAMRPEDIEMVQFKIDAKEFHGIGNGGPHLVRSFYQLLELEMVNCPRVQALPKSFAPQKLKISGCPSVTTLPDQQHSQRFHYLEVDKCSSPILLETIQRSGALEALTISNISNMTTIPMLPDYPKLGTLYIHHCEELESLSHEEGFLANCTSLKFLSVSECHNLMTFAEEGLPASLEWLTIKKCSKLVSIHGRSNDYLSKLTSLKELYLEDCPIIQSLPEDMLPVSLQHLCIKGCPLLTQHCNKNAGGKYWDMISNIIDLDVEVLNTNNPHAQPSCSCF